MELHSGRLQQVTHSPHPGVDLGRLVRPSLVHFKAHDGLPLSGWLYRPREASGPGPVVLGFHGGPESQERPIFNSTYQALLPRGIAVFAPNVRGSAVFGKRFVNLDNRPPRVEAIEDIKDCVAHVVEAGVADPKRVGIMGGSYGGFMTLSGLVAYLELFAAGVNLYGLVNFGTFFAGTEPWMAGRDGRGQERGGGRLPGRAGQLPGVGACPPDDPGDGRARRGRLGRSRRRDLTRLDEPLRWQDVTAI
jgi:dipeptidyl aminopeptidase/acylaminoacyl peptidase